MAVTFYLHEFGEECDKNIYENSRIFLIKNLEIEVLGVTWLTSIFSGSLTTTDPFKSNDYYISKHKAKVK